MTYLNCYFVCCDEMRHVSIDFMYTDTYNLVGLVSNFWFNLNFEVGL